MLSLEGEVCNSNIVSIIESKLPRALALEWYREIHKDDSKIDKRNKFPHLLSFLKVDRKALEYGLFDLRLSHETKYGKVNELNVPIPPIDKRSENCIIHRTFECRKYLSLPLTERYNLLREQFACYNCLMPGHIAISCKIRKICGINNCDRFHHPTLHQVQMWASNVSISNKLLFITDNENPC